MAYAMVSGVNGKFAGGWPYGYASWQLDLDTVHVKCDADNVIAIRLDNPLGVLPLVSGRGHLSQRLAW